MDFLQQIDNMKKKKNELDKYISPKYISKSLKFFIEDIIYLIEENNFSLKQQKEILDDVLGFEINYQTYSSFFNRHIKQKLNKKELSDKKSSDTKETKKDENLVDFFGNLNKPKKVKNIEDLINK